MECGRTKMEKKTYKRRGKTTNKRTNEDKEANKQKYKKAEERKNTDLIEFPN